MDSDSRARMRDRAASWRVSLEHVLESDSAVIAFGSRDEQRLVVKIDRHERDQSRSAAVLRAFCGNGMVRILDDVEDALLLERVSPGDALVAMAASGHDKDATEVLADVIGRMSAHEYSGMPTVEEWGSSFERYLARDGRSLPQQLVEEAREVYETLCASQRERRLLHGDLHHGNVLLDSERGWLAIDPKGVVGELEYETGAALRNPIEHPEVFLDPQRIDARVDCFADRLQLDADRLRKWTFAQAVLSAIWLIEDGLAVNRDHPWLELARRIRPG
jgi:streptomycin 6-kinase